MLKVYPNVLLALRRVGALDGGMRDELHGNAAISPGANQRRHFHASVQGKAAAKSKIDELLRYGGPVESQAWQWA